MRSAADVSPLARICAAWEAAQTGVLIGGLARDEAAVLALALPEDPQVFAHGGS